jgi:hypothetical protein
MKKRPIFKIRRRWFPRQHGPGHLRLGPVHGGARQGRRNTGQALPRRQRQADHALVSDVLWCVHHNLI